MNDKISPASAVTPKIIEDWKKANPRGIWELKVYNEDETENKTGYVRKPTRLELSAALTIKNDPLKQAAEILNDCWLGGDDELLNDEDYSQGALAQFSELMEVRKGEIKKL